LQQFKTQGKFPHSWKAAQEPEGSEDEDPEEANAV